MSGNMAEYGTSVESTASADRIWRVWSDMSTWGDWNPNVSTMDWTGGFVQGSEGVMNTRAGMHHKMKLLEVQPGRAVWRHDEDQPGSGGRGTVGAAARRDDGPSGGEGLRRPAGQPGQEGRGELAQARQRGAQDVRFIRFHMGAKVAVQAAQEDCMAFFVGGVALGGQVGIHASAVGRTRVSIDEAGLEHLVQPP